MLNIKKDFQWFKNNKNIVYADSGATTLKPNVVITAINDYLIKQSTNPHNSDSQFAYQAHGVIEKCRQASAKLLNCHQDEIIFTSGTTESLNLFANALSDYVTQDDEIVLTYFEHASNLLPWFNLADKKQCKIKYATCSGLGLEPEHFIEQLTPKTKIVSFTGTSNVLGNTLPIKAICDAIRNYNPQIIICVDLAQYVGHHVSDVKAWDVDFAAYSGHKIFGPTGIGVAYMKAEWMEALRPFKYGGGMNAGIRTDNFTFMSKYEKFEGGTPNVSGIYGLLSATNYLLEIGFANIKKHDEAIFNKLYEGLKDCKHIIVHNWEAKSPNLAFNIEGVHSQDLASYLGKKNIIVRSGLSCAKLLDYVVCAPAVVRATFFLYNDEKDIDYFIKVLKDTTKEKVLNELI